SVDAAKLNGLTADQIITSAVDQIVNGASSAMDTLAELEAFVNQLNVFIQSNDTDITALTSALAGKVDAASFESLLGDFGYQKLPSGLILQWGIASSPNDIVNTVVFPIAFPTKCTYVAVGGHAEAVENASSVMTWNYTATGFTLDRKDVGYDFGWNFYYMALGY
ncbi:MAG: hypothetical protein L3J47_12415, partial [Sulfurovum sp.]|nr:hypothetical protein [Sulfurovum sp.]